jgi:DNA (cytosine-5)-methyltransferase 1
MNELALFAGAGGGILGGHLLGWRTVCAVEWEPYPASVLLTRQNEGLLAPFPIWDDVQTFDGKPWRGIVDVISGGFPCQDISSAGKGAGIEGKRSGMWAHMARIVCEVRPRYVFVENSPMLTARGLGQVLGDLAALRYDARWCVLGANDTGAPHKRDRIWIKAELADSDSMRKLQPKRLEHYERRWSSHSGQNLADSNVSQRERVRQSIRGEASHSQSLPSSAWWRQDPAEVPQSGVGRMAHGMAARVDRLKAIGNGQVPAVAALAWNILD